MAVNNILSIKKKKKTLTANVKCAVKFGGIGFGGQPGGGSSDVLWGLLAGTQDWCALGWAGFQLAMSSGFRPCMGASQDGGSAGHELGDGGGGG